MNPAPKPSPSSTVTINLRERARLAFAERELASKLTMSPASADASFRSYYRVQTTAGLSFIVMDAPPDKENCLPFLDICGRLAKADLNVPDVLAQDLTQGFLLLRDLGNATLLPALNSQTVDSHYQHAMHAILRMQNSVDVGGMADYDQARLHTEMELLDAWFLQRHLAFQASPGERDLVQATMHQLSATALQQPRVFVHRDFHSRNLMLANEQTMAHKKLSIIDFQDAVRGPITYDLVSLLRDCYIRWDVAQVERWVEQYRLAAVANKLTDADQASFLRWFDFMGVQRHLKVLGIFARLYYRDGKAGYLKDLPLVLDYTLSVCAKHPELSEFASWLTKRTAAVDLTKAKS